MRPETRRVSVSLRKHDAPGSAFLADHEVAFHDGRPEPIEYAGRCYTYSHTTPRGGYLPGTRPEVYVFVEKPLAAHHVTPPDIGDDPDIARRFNDLVGRGYSAETAAILACSAVPLDSISSLLQPDADDPQTRD